MADIVKRVKEINVYKKKQNNNKKQKRKPKKMNKNQKKNKMKFRKQKSKYNKLGTIPETNIWLDALFNPLEHQVPVRFPDGDQTNSIALIDTLSGQSFNADYNDVTTSDSAYSCLLTLNYGLSSYDSFTPNPGNNAGWYMQIIACNQNGEAIITTPGNKIPIPTVTDNYPAIWNLSKTARLLAAGNQILSFLELNTNTTDQFITKIYAACVTPRDINDRLTAGISFVNLMKDSPGAMQFINREGVCGRYNPCQDKRQLSYYEQTEIEGQEEGYEFWDKFTMPTYLIFFNLPIEQVIVGTPSLYRFAFPIIHQSKFWIESVLKIPSPIVMTKTVYDILIDKIVKMANQDRDLACIVKGHSFKRYAVSATNFMAKLERMLKFAQGVGSLALAM